MGIWQIIWLVLSLLGCVISIIKAEECDRITPIIYLILETLILYQGGFYKF